MLDGAGCIAKAAAGGILAANMLEFMGFSLLSWLFHYVNSIVYGRYIELIV